MNDKLTETQYMPAAVEAMNAFPVHAQDVRLVSHSENVTFLITPRDGQTKYSLRLHRPGYNSLAELKSERLWTGELKNAGITVPEAVLTSNGHHFHPVDIQATGERRLTGMTTWIEGTPYYDRQQDQLMREQIASERARIIAAIGNEGNED